MTLIAILYTLSLFLAVPFGVGLAMLLIKITNS